MNSKSYLRLFCGFASVFFVLCSASPAWTQTGSYTEINPKGKAAYSTPISENTLTFELTLGSGEIAKFLIKEGGMAKFADLNEGYAFALIAVIKDMDKKSARVTIFALTQDEKGNEMVRQVEQVDASLESAITTNTKPKFQIKLISIEEARSSSASTINPKGKKAYSTPISENTLTFELTLASGEIAKFLIKEGGMAKFADLNEGYAFALTAVIKDMDKKSARVTIFALTQDEKGNEMVREVEQVDARLESTITTNTKPSFQIKLISIEEPLSSSFPDK